MKYVFSEIVARDEASAIDQFKQLAKLLDIDVSNVAVKSCEHENEAAQRQCVYVDVSYDSERNVFDAMFEAMQNDIKLEAAIIALL